jgi:hypothetical protein
MLKKGARNHNLQVLSNLQVVLYRFKNWQRLRQKPIQSRFQLFYFRINIAFFRGSGDALT